MNQRIKGGFGQVSNTVLRDPEHSLGEKALYAYLCTYADSETNELFVSVKRMASETGMGYSTIKRYIKSLESKGIIARLHRDHGTKVTVILL
jgi:DNA-binding MarR family transcriptional regulator